MSQYTIPTDTNQLSKLHSRDDVETWWMTNDQTMNLRSEHDWTIDVESISTQIFEGTHTTPSVTHDDDVERERERQRELKGFDRERSVDKKTLLEILWCDDYQDSLHGVWNSGTVEQCEKLPT